MFFAKEFVSSAEDKSHQDLYLNYGCPIIRTYLIRCLFFLFKRNSVGIGLEHSDRSNLTQRSIRLEWSLTTWLMRSGEKSIAGCLACLKRKLFSITITTLRQMGKKLVLIQGLLLFSYFWVSLKYGTFSLVFFENSAWSTWSFDRPSSYHPFFVWFLSIHITFSSTANWHCTSFPSPRYVKCLTVHFFASRAIEVKFFNLFVKPIPVF